MDPMAQGLTFQMVWHFKEEKKKNYIFGNPNSMRDYIHVKDAARISGRIIKKEK